MFLSYTFDHSSQPLKRWRFFFIFLNIFFYSQNCILTKWVNKITHAMVSTTWEKLVLYYTLKKKQSRQIFSFSFYPFTVAIFEITAKCSIFFFLLQKQSLKLLNVPYSFSFYSSNLWNCQMFYILSYFTAAIFEIIIKCSIFSSFYISIFCNHSQMFHIHFLT